jgi:ubiquinone/menaquinone biosynthesis C-methylase UbiE
LVDKEYSDPKLASLYDILNPWGPSDDFYLELIMNAESVLDVGCGTGLLLHTARERGHPGRLVGLDPAEAMLNQARVRPDIEWILGDLSTVRFNQEFDLVYMTGHVFQVFLTDDQVRQTLTTVRAALKDDGRFVFETRNPAIRIWEQWNSDEPAKVPHPDGGVIRAVTRVHLPVEGDLVTFSAAVTSPTFDGTEHDQSTLRFLDKDRLAEFLTEAGLVIEEQYGDWDRHPLTETSPEIITIARRG